MRNAIDKYIEQLNKIEALNESKQDELNFKIWLNNDNYANIEEAINRLNLVEKENLIEANLIGAIKHYFGERRKRISNKGGKGTNQGKEHNDLDKNKADQILLHKENSKNTSAYFNNIANKFKEKLKDKFKDEKTAELIVSIINFICDEESEDFYKNRKENNKANYEKIKELTDKVKRILKELEDELK